MTMFRTIDQRAARVGTTTGERWRTIAIDLRGRIRRQLKQLWTDTVLASTAPTAPQATEESS